MAVFHRATLVPTKAELIAQWVPQQTWGPPADAPIEVIGAYRFDDPDGQVGMEAFLVSAGDALLHVPLTYREVALTGADAGLLGTMQHSVLGERWVYDGLHDPVFVMMLAAVAMTGQGEALGMAVYEGRWHIAPTNVRIAGGGWSLERVPVDGFTPEHADTERAVLANDRLELTVFRRPRAGAKPPIGLTATWPGSAGPVVLAEVRDRQQ